VPVCGALPLTVHWVASINMFNVVFSFSSVPVVLSMLAQTQTFAGFISDGLIAKSWLELHCLWLLAPGGATCWLAG
jgi:hypothetical protein